MASLDFCPQKQQFGNRTVLLGNWHVYHKKMLSVGIPSIVRLSKSYLKTTLSTIFGAVKGDEELNVTVVVLLADFDEQWKERQLTDIKAKFHKFVSNGMLQVIQAPANYYEGLQHLHRSLGDHMDRVLWRSKQALDYVFLMCYCSYVSRYYLQLEDDVIASPSFVSKIRDFIFSQKSDWISLNVALLGYIGKLYPTRELQNLASYIRLFFDEMPVDWLEPRWKKYRGQDPVETKCRAASLFQHVGLISSFRPKESQRPNTLKEHYFDQFDHKYRGLNPPAEVSSDLLAISGKPADAYAGGDGHFYARCGTGGSKVFDIFLKKPTKLRRIVVETGANFAERDYIITGSLEVSLSALESRRCVHYQSVGEFRFGRIDVSLHGRQVRCIRIKIVYQGRWMYFREIDVWSSEDQQE